MTADWRPVPLFTFTAATGAAAPVEVYLLGGQSNATGQGYVKNLPADRLARPRERGDSRLGPPGPSISSFPLCGIHLRNSG